MSLIIKVEVTSTDVPKYKEVNFGTYEAFFELEDLYKHAPENDRWFIKIQEVAGQTLDNRTAYLDSIIVSPLMLFSTKPKPQKIKFEEL